MGEDGQSLAGDPARAEAANAPAYDWPVAPGEAAREVWYALVTHPDRPVALWIRYTLHGATDGTRTGRLWGAVTDRDGDLSVPVRTRVVDIADATVEDAPFRLALGEDGTLETDAATGQLSSDPGLSWDLSLVPDPAPFTPLRSDWLTSAATRLLGTGRHWSANQATRATGSMTVGPTSIDFEDAPAHQGHTVGRGIASSWQWVHCNSFPERDLTFEALRTRGRTSICLRPGRTDEGYRLNRLHHVVGPLSNRTTAVSPGTWTFRGRGDGIELHAEVRADTDHWQRATYRAPDGSLRYVAHCSLASLEVAYREDGAQGWRTVTTDRARAEWADTSPPIDGTYPPFAGDGETTRSDDGTPASDDSQSSAGAGSVSASGSNGA